MRYSKYVIHSWNPLRQNMSCIHPLFAFRKIFLSLELSVQLRQLSDT